MDPIQLRGDIQQRRKEIRAHPGDVVNYVLQFKDVLAKHELHALALLHIHKPTHLCRMVRMPFSKVQDIINQPGYRQFLIPKKKGKPRKICAPDTVLRKTQKHINYFLQAYYLWIKPPAAYGFVINPHYLGTFCNIVENARHHTGKKYVFNIDLKDFFDSITAKQVKELFLSDLFDYNEEIATALTFLTTYKGKLPTGAPTSPVLANFMCYRLDAQLSALATQYGFTYTRYADDLTFSGNEKLSDEVKMKIIELIQQNSFTVNGKKVYQRMFFQQQKVTGLVVNEKVNVDRKFIRKVRAMIHDVQLNGMDAAVMNHYNITTPVTVELRAKFISRLEGYLSFIGQIRGKRDLLYLRYKTAFDNFFITEGQGESDEEYD